MLQVAIKKDLGEVYRAYSKDLATNKVVRTTRKMRQKEYPIVINS
jgi:hypothetical protein